MSAMGSAVSGTTGELRPGQAFQDAWEILEPIGSGSFGRVYKARQRSTRQLVAIKVLRFVDGDSRADIENQIERFRREARLCAELSHPNIVPLVDSGETADGRLYAVFQYIPGSTLKEVLAEEGTLSWNEAAHLITQVLDALACAHARGIVHRDLKPENIMVTSTGIRRNALVLDFGLGGFWREVGNRSLARLTPTHELMGAPCHAAPEQLRAATPSPRSDLYSCALILLECLSGESAMTGASAHEIIAKQLSAEPVPIPACIRNRRLRHVLQMATAKRVEERNVTVEALVRALGGFEPAPSHGASVLPDGERRQLTIVACSVTVTSSSAVPPDIEELDELLVGEHARLSELATRAGGHVAAVTGGSTVITFGYPHAREDEARRAVRTAIRIAGEVERTSARLGPERGLGLDVRIGIHTGVVIVRERHQGQPLDLVGVTPQVATRLSELAGPGEILASEETQRLLRGAIRSDAAGERRLPELSRALRVFRISGEGGESPSFVRETPLVGRGDQLARLVDLWHRTQAARGGAVLVSGEPGIGKSRLVRELRRRVPPDAWVEARCIAENQDSPLLAVADMVAAMGEPLDSMLARRGLDVAESFPPLAAALSLPPDDRFPPRSLAPDRAKEAAFDTLLRLLFAMAADRPVVVAFEDLHWADPTTLELLSLVVRELEAGAAPLLLVMTARPEFVPPWAVTDVIPLPLPRLEPEQVQAMVNAGLASGSRMAEALLHEVVRRSDGVPLFVEEVTRLLTDTADAVDATDARLPATVRDLLAARLDAVSPGARGTAQLAAVLGREFAADPLRAASPQLASVVRDDLEELVEAGVIYRRRTAARETYVFKHGLLRDAAYDAMTRTARRRLHVVVAGVLRERFPELVRDRPEMIALHHELGGEPTEAIEHWRLAGERTMARAAYAESIRLFERALGLLAQLPASSRRAETELDLTQSLGMAFLFARGYTAPEVVRTFDRALTLCEEAGGDVPFRVVAGLWNVKIALSERAACEKLLPALDRLAEREPEPAIVLTAHAARGAFDFYRG